MMEQGIMLMVTGMGVVFLFLTLMVGVMYLTAAFFKKFGGRFSPNEAQPADRLRKIAVALAVVRHRESI